MIYTEYFPTKIDRDKFIYETLQTDDPMTTLLKKIQDGLPFDVGVLSAAAAICYSCGEPEMALLAALQSGRDTLGLLILKAVAAQAPAENVRACFTSDEIRQELYGDG